MRHCLIAWLLCMLGCADFAQAAGCTGPYPVAFRTLPMGDGRVVSVWYPKVPAPSAGNAEDGSSQRTRRRATADSTVGCGRWPLILFSHGLAGCGTQVVFLTEQIAGRGYVVAAPNHHDALCGNEVEGKPWSPGSATQPPFMQPELWDERARRDRMLDLRETLRLVIHDAGLGPVTDASRIGLIGHSLGGYTVLGMSGAWPEWTLPGTRAVIAASPFVAPFLAHQRLESVRVPVMYQGGTLDFGITPDVVRDGGAYAQTPAPKFLVDLDGATHLAWTNWECREQDTVAACLADTPNARLIDAYALAFLDHYLKGLPESLLDGNGEGLARWQKAL